jgi:hypothetical protein
MPLVFAVNWLQYQVVASGVTHGMKTTWTH